MFIPHIPVNYKHQLTCGFLNKSVLSLFLLAEKILNTFWMISNLKTSWLRSASVKILV